ncbi:hypothetical protein [Actinomadura opuntiae]|uniref:hypothetical protein n=1 Tax=Actinomadura sp. OS1-43 TaxID=604315 RepID=UPI00255ABAAD|nr:hypothetical protein [Actinomadura sp. OS1-43]MDL4821403.1 hypothetical protein [Actinomadura sp. OS1-43]
MCPRDVPLERLLDATSAMVATGDWDALRLAQVARAAGVMLMRVTVSHVVAPLHGPGEVARGLAELTRRLLA